VRRILALAVLLAAAPVTARADDTRDAEQLAEEGERLIEAGRLGDACPKFDASLALAPDDLEVRRSLATCREDLGQLATAWTAWRDLKQRARAAGLTELAVVATDHITAIEPKLAHLTLRAPDAPDGLLVSLDGKKVPASSLDAAAAIDQGEHRITAEAPGYQPWVKELFIENGAYKTVDVGPLTAEGEEPIEQPLEPGEIAPPKPVKASSPAAPSQARKYVGIAATVIGGVVVGVGAWAAIAAKGQRDDARALGCTDDLSSCPSGAAFDAADAAYGRANLATGLLVGGGAVAVAGVILWLTAPSAPPTSSSEGVSWRLDLGADHAGVAFARTF